MKRLLIIPSLLVIAFIVLYFTWLPFRLLLHSKVYYDESGILTKHEISYDDWVMEMHFYPNGNYRLIERYNKENKRIGYYTTYYVDGSAKDTVYYNNGLKNGIEVQYDSLGKMSYWAYHIMDSLHMEFIFYYDSLGEISEILSQEFNLDVDHDLPGTLSMLEHLLRQQKSH